MTPNLSVENIAGKRADIQILRAYAVIIVILYHSGLGYLPQGFIGVDVFFVISGYLITSHIRRDIKASVFSITNFYARRMKRLLPAAYVTFAAVLVAAPFILSGAEARDFGKQIIGAVGFVANYILKNQTGYFEGAADLKPLLHTWSLSVEEQFYFLIPPLLLITPYRFHGVLIGLVTLMSYLACWYAKANPETIFYTLPYRAWELGLGAIAGFFVLPTRSMTKGRAGLLLMATVLLIVMPMISQFQGKNIIPITIACLSSFVVIYAAGLLNAKGYITRALVGIGDISYSLYLVHWPLFSIYNNIIIGGTEYDKEIRLLILFITFVSAFFLNKTIERRFIEIRCSNKRIIFYSVISGVFLISLSWLYIDISSDAIGKEGFREKNAGFSDYCSRIGPLDMTSCRNSEFPQYMVWGDSMAMQLVDGLVSSRTPPIGLVQATRHHCEPLMGVSSRGARDDSDFKWAKSCLDFNEEVIATLRGGSSIKTIILSGNLIDLLKPNRMIISRYPDGSLTKEINAPDRIYKALETTVQSLRQRGLRVVFVLPPPSAQFDVGRCIARRLNGMPVFGSVKDCSIDAEEFLKRRNERLDAFVARVRENLNLSVIAFDDSLCRDGHCMTMMDDIPLYRDDVHFSIEGGRYLIQKIALLNQIDQLAR